VELDSESGANEAEATYLNDADHSDPVWAEFKEEVEEFDDSWLEQLVLETNVDPLTDAIAARNLSEKKQKIMEIMGVKV